MNKEIEDLYKSELDSLRRFMDGEASKSSRKNGWSEKQKISEIERNPICLTCDEKLTLQNLTREHIHPLCLGGVENPKNVIAMCIDCNSARNSVMFDAIGFKTASAIKKRWPVNRHSVESFLVWANATTNGDKHTVQMFSEFNQAFAEYRKIKSIISSSSKKKPKVSELATETSRITKLRKLGNSIVNMLKKPTTNNNKIIVCVCGLRLRYDSSKLSKPGSYFRCPECEEKIASKSSVSLPRSDVNQQHELTNGLNQKRSQIESKFDQSQQIDNLTTNSEFPMLTRINVRNGLKLPRDPEQMAEIINWLYFNDLEYNSWPEIREDLSAQSFIKITPTKIHSTLIKITMWIDVEGDLQSEDFSRLREKISEIGLNGLISVIENVCRNHKIIEEADLENLNLYFGKVRSAGIFTKSRFSQFILTKLSLTGKIDLGALSKPHLDDFIELEGHTKLTELKLSMGYFRNTRLKKIIEDLCGDKVRFTTDPNNDKKIFIELSD